MKIYIEKNKKFGRGYQLRFAEEKDGEIAESVIDFRPYTSLTAAVMARRSLMAYNKNHGTNYRLEDVLTKG